MALVWWLKHFALKLRYIIPLEVRTSTYEIFSNMYFYFSKSFGIWISLKRMSFFSMLTSSSNFSLQHSSYLSSSICTAFPTVAIFRQMGDFWGRAGDHFFAKIASEIWAIFGILEKWPILGEICEISWRNGRFLTIFGKNVTAKSADFGQF